MGTGRKAAITVGDSITHDLVRGARAVSNGLKRGVVPAVPANSVYEMVTRCNSPGRSLGASHEHYVGFSGGPTHLANYTPTFTTPNPHKGR